MNQVSIADLNVYDFVPPVNCDLIPVDRLADHLAAWESVLYRLQTSSRVLVCAALVWTGYISGAEVTLHYWNAAKVRDVTVHRYVERKLKEKYPDILLPSYYSVEEFVRRVRLTWAQKVIAALTARMQTK